MPAILLTAPAAEPITLADAKAYLRLEHDAEDELVGTLIAAAAAQVESLTRRVLVAQRWRLDVAVPADRAPITLRPRPVREVEAVRRRLADGTTAPVDAGGWRFDWAGERLFLKDPPGCAEIEVDLAVGYGAPEEVPDTLKLAVRRLVADAFERRSPSEGAPADVLSLIAPYRDLRL